MWNPFKSRKAESTDLVPTDNKEYADSNDYCPVQQPSSPDVPVAQPLPGEASTDMVPMSKAKAQIAMVEMGVGVVNKALDVYNLSTQVDRDIAAIRAASDVQLAQITTKFEFCKSALDHVFYDRHSALSAHYCVLEDAMKSNDRELIINALKGISSIVVTSPLSDFKEIVNNWDGYSKKKPLELDF